MPAVSEKQRRFMGAELGRKRAGKKTETGMSEKQLSDFAHKTHAKKKHHLHKAMERAGKEQYPATGTGKHSMHGKGMRGTRRGY